MPSTAEQVSHRHTAAPLGITARVAAALDAPGRPRRRRRRLDPHAPAGFGQGAGQAAAALQRSLDRRDNGGATGH
ncbi:hypothetical protein ACFZB9_33625 [Kitasatospora sp. NPDC008050]|uniref:hypothetical protein n=1 Tax=Kitasatospora sp. NPDC008050 TaxID=3364021 RepID=UPI0036EB78A8